MSETVDITIKVPKALIEFFRIVEDAADMPEFITKTLLEFASSQIEGMTPSMIVDIFKLDPVFKEYGIKP